MSKKELLYNLYLLKKMLISLDIQKIKNIDFININAFCDYLDNKNDNKYNSLKILKKIEKYIPLSLCNNIDTYYLLESGLSSFDTKYIKNIKQIFYKKSILSFLYSLSQTNTKSQFLIVFKNCNNIRKYYINVL